MKIRSIEAENFKLFTNNFNSITDISANEMVLFNGPNGYGKTSVFDIIEFCLTGEIKRIRDYSEELAISKNEAFDNKILISDESKESFVKLVLEDDGKDIEICYSYDPIEKKKGSSKENNPYKIFECFTRKITCNGEEITNQELTNKLQFNNINEVFDKCCFLSQDEHLQFLKTTKKSKAEALSFLFDVPDEWKKELERVSEQLYTLKNRRKTNSYINILENKAENKRKEKEELEAEIHKSNTEGDIVYKRLFTDKEIPWDKESVLFDRVSYKNAKIDLENLIFFSEHKGECINFIFNIPYANLLKDFDGDKDISFSQSPLEYSYRFIGLLKDAETIEKRHQREKKAQSALNCIQEKRYEEINWPFIQEEKLLDDNSILAIKQQLVAINSLRKTQGIIQKTMIALGQSRENILKNADVVMKEGGISDNQCPLCGALYSDKDELYGKIKKESDLLSSLSDQSVIAIQEIKNQIYNNYLIKVEKTLHKLLENVIAEELYQNLIKVKENESQILKVENLLENIGIGLDKKESESIEDGYNNLLDSIRKALKYVPKEVEIELDNRDFLEFYDRFYNKNQNLFNSVDRTDLNNKKKYIENLNYNHYLAKLSKNSEELKHIEKRINKLNKIISELENYQDVLKKGIQGYKAKIIEDIEPLLHVYTAKILQQKFNGKSIYIHTDDDVENIQFVNSPQDKQDILYSMSSGQLSAVALSFLLCMNQTYGSNKACSLLLIDDPVQTIDDVNMVGLVDILRFEFGDRQIFISTHEQSFEWFLRYRYSKAGKNVRVFNMKDIMLQDKQDSKNIDD